MCHLREPVLQNDNIIFDALIIMHISSVFKNTHFWRNSQIFFQVTFYACFKLVYAHEYFHHTDNPAAVTSQAMVSEMTGIFTPCSTAYPDWHQSKDT